MAFGCLAHDVLELVGVSQPSLVGDVFIAFVRPDRCLLALQNFVLELAIMDLRRRRFQAVADATSGYIQIFAFIPKYPSLLFLVGHISGSRGIPTFFCSRTDRR